MRLASERTGIATEVVMAVDSWEPAARVRDANLAGVRTTIANVKDMTRGDFPPHDLVIGGPPCQPWSMAGKRQGADDTRDCLPDFVRLRGDCWLMENVTSRLLDRMGGGWSEKLCAADFGDVTDRKRWFYSSHVLHVMPTPGPKRIRDIRDHAEDARIIAKRYGCKAGKHEHYDDNDSLRSLTAHAWHGHDVRTGKLLAIKTHQGEKREKYNDRAMLPSLMSDASYAMGTVPATLHIGLRGYSSAPIAKIFQEDEVLGSLLANSSRGSALKTLIGCRNPSLLEMARAHSISDSWEWAGITKTQRGQIIANGWPIGLGTAICSAMLQALLQYKALE